MTDDTAPKKNEPEGDPELEVVARLGTAAREGDTERSGKIADAMRITGKHQ